MRACLLLCVAAALVGAARAECDACLDGHCYHKHSLPLTQLAHIYDIDRNTNILYVSDEYKSKQCQVDTGRCNITNNPWDMWSLVVDQTTGDTYGTIYDDYGVYLLKLDLINNKKLFQFSSGANLITFKDKLYYTTYHTGIYKFEDTVSRVVAGIEEYYVDSFIVDKKDDIYFKTKLDDMYVIRRLSKGVVDRTKYWDMNCFLTVDRDGNAVFVNPESRAVYRAADGQLVEVGVINDSIFHKHMFNKPLFDRDNNVIYRHSSLNYFHLKRDKDINCTYSISQNTVTITELVL